MAGRFVYWMNISLDPFIEREAGEHGDKVPSWMRLGKTQPRPGPARRARPGDRRGRESGPPGSRPSGHGDCVHHQHQPRTTITTTYTKN
jgi:hypothetical protein